MTKKRVVTVLLSFGLLAVGLLGGCSDDKATTATDGTLEFSVSAFDELITAIAPPTFTDAATPMSPVAALTADTSYGFWAQGNCAMLGRSFGESEPMALYRNARRLGETVQWMNRIRRIGDTTFSSVQTDDGEVSGTMSVVRLHTPVQIPEPCRAVLGDTALPLQYRVEVRFEAQTQTKLQAGLRRDDTCEVLLAYHGFPSPDSIHPEAYEHCLMYAYRHRIRDSVQLRAVHFRAYNDSSGQCSMWAYQVNSRNSGQFFYRMSWYADDFADTCGLGCLIGSGHRETQFALRYQQMTPADRLEPDLLDPYGHVQHVFGAAYADHGATLSSGLNEATDPVQMFHLEHLPVALRNGPVLAEGAFNPWYQD